MTASLALWFLRSALFFTVLTPTCWYALQKGGGPERSAAAMVVVAAIATAFVPTHSYRHVVEPLLIIDVLMLAGLTALALTADRYWPLYFTALQLLTVALHGVRAYDPAILPELYARLGGELAYPTLITLALGTRRHVNRGSETDWYWQIRHDSYPTSIPGPNRHK